MGFTRSGRLDDNFSEFIHGVQTVGTTATELKVGASRLIGRQGIIIQNESNEQLRWGSSDVSMAGLRRGLLIEPNEVYTIEATDDVGVYIIGPTEGNDIVVMEIA